MAKNKVIWLALTLITLAGFGLRVMAWRWSEFRPLGGDEREYLDLAIHLAQGKGYYDLPLMRPPLFPAGLAVLVWLTDGAVQALRFANLLVSTATIPLMFWWTRRLFGANHVATPLLAATLAAASYTLALNATELLTETVTLFGLTLLFGMLAGIGDRASGIGDRASGIGHRGSGIGDRASGKQRAGSSKQQNGRVKSNSESGALSLHYSSFIIIAAGVLLGLICLVRSVALPLLPLGMWWLWRRNVSHMKSNGQRHRLPSTVYRLPFLFGLSALLMIAPWTVRNAVSYGGFILIDTTGPENLWLDNDPAGREAVKAQLYALGDDRVQRSALATSNAIAAITNNFGWFAAKSWHEFRRFWALEHADDMLDRRAIWVSPPEVWARLLLGDGVWLIVLLAGAAGLVLAPLERSTRTVLLLWALYTLATGVLFHVEVRYRLPLWPVLLPCAAWALTWVGALLASRRVIMQRVRSVRGLLAATVLASLLVLTLTWRPYIATGLNLARKHLLLGQAEEYLAQSGAVDNQARQGVPVYLAQAKAAQALQRDPDSLLGRVLLARVDLALGDLERADEQLQAAIATLPAHPYAHLLRGDLLRAQGADVEARRELRYETASREDLQRWALHRFSQTPLTGTLDIGGGLDLGFISDFHAAEADGTRWSRQHTTIYLAPAAGTRELVLRVAAARPASASSPTLQVRINDLDAGTYAVANDWQELRIPLPASLDPAQPTVIDLTVSTTFTPHDYDRFNADGRDLGVQLDWVRLQ